VQRIAILLRAPRHRSLGEPGASAFEEIEATAKATVEIDDLNANGVRQAQYDPTVLVSAPVLPMKLIEPLTPSPNFAHEVGPTTWGVAAVGAPNSPFTGAGVTVAVLDTGIDTNQPALTGVNLVKRDFTGGRSVKDTNGHGTHCAGTIFGRDVNGLRIGVATGVTKAALIGKVLGGRVGGGSDILCQAIMWAADNGANVISMSLGIDFPGFVRQLVEEEGRSIPVATSLALEQYRANIRLFDHVSSVLGARGRGSAGCRCHCRNGERERAGRNATVRDQRCTASVL
jgi:subtilisin family serine protease